MTNILGNTREATKFSYRPGWGLTAATLATLFVYAFVFTDLWLLIGTPSPTQLLGMFDAALPNVFEDYLAYESNIRVPFNSFAGFTFGRELLVLFSTIALTFLASIAVKSDHRTDIITAGFILGMVSLFGAQNTIYFTALQILVYIGFHSSEPDARLASVLPGVAGAMAMSTSDTSVGFSIISMLAGGAVSFIILGLGLPRLMSTQSKSVKPIQILLSQAAMIYTFGAISLGFLTEGSWKLPVAVLLFFWQFQRVHLYYIDYHDGCTPRDLSLSKHLSLFFSPAMLSNQNWGEQIGQSYRYLNSKHLATPANQRISGALKLLWLALAYMLFMDEFIWFVVDVFRSYDIHAYTHIRNLIIYESERPATTQSVLATCFIEQVRWFFLMGGVTHFKTAIWRLFGYDVDPMFNKPWLATNLVAFWSRFTYHYREYLVRAFYYPVFFRYFKRQPTLRVVAGTVAAAGVGNLVWGHISQTAFYFGSDIDKFALTARTWPYFLLLAVGIGLTQLYLIKVKRKRRPWSKDRYLLRDVLSVYLTIQFYGLIQIFARTTPESSLLQHTQIFLLGLGLDVR